MLYLVFFCEYEFSTISMGDILLLEIMALDKTSSIPPKSIPIIVICSFSDILYFKKCVT